MKTVEDYLRHADACDRLARSAVSDEQRKMILDMAESWRLLAETRQRLAPKSGPSSTRGNGAGK